MTTDTKELSGLSESKELSFPEFDKISVSTKTFIVKTNIVIDLKNLFEFLPVVDYVIVPKKRGRKKKLDTIEQNKDIPNGSIITLKYENKLRGVDLKQKKVKKKSKWFRNSFTVVIVIDDKTINFKVCQNGMIQLTGIKFDKQAEDCVKIIWDHIRAYENSIYTFSRSNQFEALFIPAMRNIDFSIGFNVDREKLSRYMCVQTDFHSLLETSFGYTGVNLKMPIVENIKDMRIKKLTYNGEWVEKQTDYSEYLKHLTDKEQIKKLNKERFNTFLIFQTGKVILSTVNEDYARASYEYFLKIIRTCHKEIEEVLDE